MSVTQNPHSARTPLEAFDVRGVRIYAAFAETELLPGMPYVELVIPRRGAPLAIAAELIPGSTILRKKDRSTWRLVRLQTTPCNWIAELRTRSAPARTCAFCGRDHDRIHAAGDRWTDINCCSSCHWARTHNGTGLPPRTQRDS